MKRFLVIPIMFIYLLAVSGIMINMHYCGQELESWNVYLQNDGCEDGDCGDESNEPDGCCENKVVAAKVSFDQNTAAEVKVKLSTILGWAALPPIHIFPQQEEAVRVATVTSSNQPNAPPGLWQQIPLYKLHTSFTYYG